MGCKDIPDKHNHMNVFYGIFASCWQTYLFQTFFRAWIKEIEKATNFHFLYQNSANILANTEFPILCLVHCAFILSAKGTYHFCINTQVFRELPIPLIYPILLWKEIGISVSISLPCLNLSFNVKILLDINWKSASCLRHSVIWQREVNAKGQCQMFSTACTFYKVTCKVLFLLKAWKQVIFCWFWQ